MIYTDLLFKIIYMKTDIISYKRKLCNNILSYSIHPFKDPKFINKMKIYREQHCDTFSLSEKQMFDYIDRGENIVNSLKKTDTKSKININECTDKDVCSIIWFLMAKATMIDEQYEQGMFAFPDEDKLIFNYLLKHPYVYGRISTHYQESSESHPQSPWIGHFGIDPRSGSLPAFMRTILFGHRQDGSTFIKIEEHGCPPFWRWKFLTLGNILEFLGHAFDYIRSRPIFRCVQIWRSERLETRTEDIHSNIYELFSKIINKYTHLSHKEKRNALIEGERGLSFMYNFIKKNEKDIKPSIDQVYYYSKELIKKHDEKINNLPILKKLHEKFFSDVEHLIERDEILLGELSKKIQRKGNEVILSVIHSV